MDDDFESTYNYRGLAFLNLTTFPFQRSYLIPGLVDSRNEALIIVALAEIDCLKNQKNLDVVLGISRPAITMNTTELIRKGLIVQELNPSDHRSFILSLTELGKKVANCLNKRRQYYNKIQLKGITKEEIKKFNSMCIRMATNFLDMSDREMKSLPEFKESEWKNDTDIKSLLSEEDQNLYIALSKKTKKITWENNKKSTI